MDDKRIQYLVEQYLTDSLALGERAEFLGIVADPAYHDRLEEVFDRLLDDVHPADYGAETLSPLLYELLARDRYMTDGLAEKPEPQTVKVWRSVWFRVAAAVLITVLASILWRSFQQRSPSGYDYPELASTALPGSHKAVLTLTDGRSVYLDGNVPDTVVKLGSTTVLRADSAGIVYRAGSNQHSEVGMNTISTPRGGHYRIVLADGTKVWLNAASSISFPVNFSQDERFVRLEGEAYFEVNSAVVGVADREIRTPFTVSVNGVAVRVLGTHFNINAYGGEDYVQTSLLEGAVVVSKGGASQQIKPGQQATFNGETGKIAVSDADMAHVMAWRENRFDFNGSLKDIMGQLARWYDVETAFEMRPGGEDQLFIGSITRQAPLDKVLKMIEQTGDVHFRFNDNKIIAMD